MANRQGGWNIPKKQGANAGAGPEPVRLSQCMIVKNEEKNIERALTWAKDIAFEQIVVDTGSTDRTVEIAGRMGAKVYHFTWINDFAAAKNYAIERAKGNWIAFLDADEYITEDQIPKLRDTLDRVQAMNFNHPEKPHHMIRCALAHLKDDGSVVRVDEHDRFFINSPAVRYTGMIHERIHIPDGETFRAAGAQALLTIYHTGYTSAAYKDTNKLRRNIEMLTLAINKEPGNIDLVMYLADSLFVAKQYKEAAQMYMRGFDVKGWNPNLREVRYDYLMRALQEIQADIDTMQFYCERAVSEFPDYPAYYYYRGLIRERQGNPQAAWESYLYCESMINDGTANMASSLVGNIELLYNAMFHLALKRKDIAAMVKYTTLLVKQKRYEEEYVRRLLECFQFDGMHTPAADVLALLRKLFDYTNLKDKLVTLKCAMQAGQAELAELIKAEMTEDEREWLEKE